jgi:putative inorganic carbon (HCO3(-)) transporter
MSTHSFQLDRQPVDQSRLQILVAIALAAAVVPLSALAAFHPVAALLLFAGLVVGVVSILHAQVALLLLVASAPIEGAFLIGGSETLTVTKLAGGLCFASFILYALTFRRRLLFDQSHVIVLGILAIAIFSTLQAEEIPAAITVTLRYASFVALYIVASQFVGDQPFQRRLAWVLSLACTAAALIALSDVIRGRTLLATLHYGDPNDTAYMLATSLPLMFWLLRERWALKPIVLAMIGLTSASVILSYSRGALVGVGAAIVWQALTERRSIPIILAGLLAVVVAITFVVHQNPTQIRSGFRAKEKVASYNVSTRLDAWGAAIDLATWHPVLGIGPGNFQFRYPDVTERPPGSSKIGVVHDTYLDVAAELGIFAALLFIAYYVIVFSRATIAIRRGNGLPGYAAAVRTSLVIAAVSGLFLSEQYFAPFWLFGGLATALWREGKLIAPDR